MRAPIKDSCHKSNYPLAECLPKGRRTSSRKKYGVKARFAKLFDAIESAGWRKSYRLFSVPTLKRIEQASIPPENIAAIKLLDSWLNEEGGQDHSKEWEDIKRTIDENRLSDRKLFS